MSTTKYHSKRFEAIARDYVLSPVGRLVVSPDTLSRRELNEAIHAHLRAVNKLGEVR